MWHIAPGLVRLHTGGEGGYVCGVRGGEGKWVGCMGGGGGGMGGGRPADRSFYELW